MLVIHIGTHKTGTTALQSFLARHSDSLRDKGLRYLATGRDDTTAHHPLPWSLRGKHKVPMSIWAKLRAELGHNPARYDVLSSEGFWFTEAAAVKAELAGVRDVRIVMYLRRQDKYLQSLYKQTVTGGRRISFEEWRAKYVFRGDYLKVVRDWVGQFGAEAVEIRPYERRGATVNVVGDFLGALGIDAGEEMERVSKRRRNPTPRREVLNFIRAFNQLDLECNRDAMLASIVRRNDAYIRSADLLDPAQCAALMAEFAQSNGELAARYYRDRDDPLFPELVQAEMPEIWGPESREYFEMTADFLDVIIRGVKQGTIGGPKLRGKRRRAAAQFEEEQEE